MPLCFRVVCYTVVENKKRCWRENFYHLSIATIMQCDTWRQNLVDFNNSIYFSYWWVCILPGELFRLWGCWACSRLKAGFKHSDILSFIWCQAEGGGSTWSMLGYTYAGVQEQPCKTFWYLCLLHIQSIGQVGHMVKFKVKKVSTFPSTWEKKQKKGCWTMLQPTERFKHQIVVVVVMVSGVKLTTLKVLL